MYILFIYYVPRRVLKNRHSEKSNCVKAIYIALIVVFTSDISTNSRKIYAVVWLLNKNRRKNGNILKEKFKNKYAPTV